MMNNMTWDEFCELYWSFAQQKATYFIEKKRKDFGGFSDLVDVNYVRDESVLTAMEKAYKRHDDARGASITTYLSTIIHNEVVDTLKKETDLAARQSDIDDIKTAIKSTAEEASSEIPGELLARLRQAIEKLDDNDQVILHYYLEDKSTYVEKSAKRLNITPSSVHVKRFRIFQQLPKLMEMTRKEYLDYRLQNQTTMFESILIRGTSQNSRVFRHITKVNCIDPSVDTAAMAGKLLKLISE